jgi:hypothetical protein
VFGGECGKKSNKVGRNGGLDTRFCRSFICTPCLNLKLALNLGDLRININPNILLHVAIYMTYISPRDRRFSAASLSDDCYYEVSVSAPVWVLVAVSCKIDDQWHLHLDLEALYATTAIAGRAANIRTHAAFGARIARPRTFSMRQVDSNPAFSGLLEAD